MFKEIPLNKLHLSESNVRKDVDDLDVEPLAQDIHVHGLIQNLVVEPRSRPKGHYDVFAGGRRLRALNHNLEQGLIAKDFLVGCDVRKKRGNNAAELSLSENYQRLKMTPADEIAAFHRLVEKEGMSSQEIADRFGIDKRAVDGRLRLAGLHDDIMQALRARTITLDHAKAYAATVSQERQKQVFDIVGEGSPSQVLRLINQDSMSSNDPVALFVGQEAYSEAGGRIELQLFNDDGDTWIDPEIVQKLAMDKIEVEAKTQQSAHGLAWVRPILATHVSWSDKSMLHDVRVPLVPLNAEQEAELEQLEADADASWEKYDQTEEEAAAEEHRQQYFDLQKKIEDYPRKKAVLTSETMEQLGQFLILDKEGNALLDDGLHCESQIHIDADGAITVKPVKKLSGNGDASNPDGSMPVDDGTIKLSVKVADELSVQRRDVLAANLTAHPELAMNFMLFALADAKTAYGRSCGTTLSAPAASDPVTDYPKGAANDQIASAHDILDTSWCDHDNVTKRFDAFCALPDNDKLDWCAYIAALSLQSSGSHGMSLNYSLQGHLAEIMDVDFAAFWRPTAANYWDRIKKASILGLFEEIGGVELKSRNSGSKKADLAKAAEKLFSGAAIVEPEIKEAAIQWIPPEMHFGDINAQRREQDKKDQAANDDTLPTADDDDGVDGKDTDAEAPEAEDQKLSA